MYIPIWIFYILIFFAGIGVGVVLSGFRDWLMWR